MAGTTTPPATTSATGGTIRKPKREGRGVEQPRPLIHVCYRSEGKFSEVQLTRECLLRSCEDFSMA
jgi:hypothetical protein